jgi:hypothetical protein
MTDQALKGGQSDSQLDDILRRVKYVGPEPALRGRDYGYGVDEVSAVRAERGKGRLEQRPPRRNWRG